MPSIDIKDLRQYVAQCDPTKPLPANDPLYVPLDEGTPVRGGEHSSCIDELFQTIYVSEPTGETRQLFTGFSGTGKTTELRRLEYKLNNAPDVLTRTIFIDIEQYVDRYIPISITDVLRVLAFCLDSAAQRAEGKDPETPDYLKRFWTFLQTEIYFSKLNLASYGGMSLMLELKNNPDFRAKAEAALSPRFQQFAADAKRVMSESVVRIREAAEVQRVVVIVDGLEKLTPLREEDRGNMEASVESVFLQHADFLRLPCHVIYTFPLWLRFNTAALGAQYDREPLILPMVKIANQDGTIYQPGIDKLVELIGRRVDSHRVFGADPATTLIPIINASGGYPRDLLRMVRELLRSATEFPASHAKVELVIDRLAEDYSRIIRSTDLDILAAVAGSHKLPRSDSAQLASFGRLLEKWLVLAYRNGKEWYDLHPLVRRSSLVQERLNSNTSP